MTEDFILDDLGQSEPMRDQAFRLERAGGHGLKKHSCRRDIDQTGGQRDIAVPEFVEMEDRAFAVDADIGDMATRRDNLLAGVEPFGNSDGLDGDINALACSQSQNPWRSGLIFGRLAMTRIRSITAATARPSA